MRLPAFVPKLAFALTLEVACFALDINVSRDYPVWLGYFFPFFVIWETDTRSITVAVAMAIIFLMTGLLLATPGHEPVIVNLIARLVGGVIFWIFGFLSIVRLRNVEVLKQREEQVLRQALILEQVQDAIVTIDNESRIQYMNQAAYRNYDIDPDEPVLGSKLGEFFRFEWRSPEQLQEYLHSIQQAGIWKGEKIHVTHKGRRIWGESVISLTKDTKGNPTGVAAVVRDITQRKEAEIALEESRERLRDANEAAGIGTWSLDPATGAMDWDATTRDHWGFSHEAELSFDKIKERLCPEGRVKLDEAVRSISTGREITTLELRVRMPDGSTRHLRSTGRATKDAAGRVVKIFGTSLDITVEKEREQSLRDYAAGAEEGRNILTALMEHIPIGLAIADAPEVSIRILSRYGQETLMQADEELAGVPLGKPLSKGGVFHTDGVTPALRDELPLIRAMNNGEIVNNEEWIFTGKDGTCIPVLCNAAPIRNREGAIVGGVLGWHEIAGRRALENELRKRAAELERANRELESFSYSVTHDLRSPLQALIGFSAMLKEDHSARLNEDGRNLIERIARNSRKMESLIDDILNLSKVAGQEIKLEKIFLCRVAHSIIADLRKGQPDRQIKTTVQQDCSAMADARLMTIALTNLIGNAWKYTLKTKDPEIEFGCLEKNGQRVFFVRDNGAGFDMKQADRLFVPFRRLHAEREFSGTGVGLATVARIVSRHGGRIWAEAEVGKGATFYFTLG